MIALTGATGFLGSHLAKYLSRRKFPLRCLVRKNSPRLERLHGLDLQINEADFGSVSSLTKALSGCDVVIHTLGLINGSDKQLHAVNVEFTRNLVKAAGEAGVQKFIFISSVAAQMKHGPYGLSKHAAEETVRASGIPYLIFRPAWIFGPDDLNNSAILLNTLKRLPVVPLLGGGTFKIQPVYVDDVVSLVAQGLHFSRMNTAYTVAGPEQIPLRDILEEFSRRLEFKRWFLPIPLKPVQSFFRFYLKLNPRTRLPAKQILELDKHEAFDISETRRDFQFNPMKFSEGCERMFAGPCVE